MRWIDFQDFLHNLEGVSAAIPDEARSHYEIILASSAARMITQVAQARSHASLFEQVMASAKLGCTDVRDKIYGVLGIVETGHAAIVADYEIPQNIFMRFY